MNRLIIDLHAHPQLKPLNSSENERDKRDYRNLASCNTGFEMRKVDKIFTRIENKKGVDYFHEELQPEYSFLKNEAEKSKYKQNKMGV